MSLDVFEGVGHQTTTATVGLGIAIDKLLFREGDELTSGNEVTTFESTSGRESPAGTAGTLVLDGGDSTLLSPIDFTFESGGVDDVLLSGGLEHATAHLGGGEFGVGHISERSGTNGVRVVLSVDLLSPGHVVFEDLSTVGTFGRKVVLSIFSFKSREVAVDAQGESDGKESKDNSLHIIAYKKISIQQSFSDTPHEFWITRFIG